MLNTDKVIHPWHWDVSQFEECPGLSPSKEFDLIAPIAIFFYANMSFSQEANKAWKQLKKIKHPIAVEMGDVRFLKITDAPRVFDRYKALFMRLAKDLWPDAVFDQDYYGALSVQNPSSVDKDQLSGDAHGQFPWFLSFQKMQNRFSLTA